MIFLQESLVAHISYQPLDEDPCPPQYILEAPVDLWYPVISRFIIGPFGYKGHKAVIMACAGTMSFLLQLLIVLEALTLVYQYTLLTQRLNHKKLIQPLSLSTTSDMWKNGICL
uniref:Probable protein L3 n=1 Tax=Bos taurus papillomavirus 4 TaxID=10562 RepID=VL3_BPV4|nr:RecName: Full=Probable protein L3 [Bos taurus papillomavirus 4]